ncbi:DNA ligase 3-like isoform X1 [Styela clava]
MSDSTRFTCDYAKRKANCKKCKQPIDKGVARIAKVTPNFFNDGDGEMKMYHHINCMFEVFSRARATTKKIEDPSDLEGFADMEDDEKNQIKKLIAELCAKQAEKQAKSPRGGGKKATPKKQKPAKAPSPVKMKASPLSKPIQSASIHTLSTSADSSKPPPPFSKDNNFREYRRLCAMIADESSYNEKTNIVKNFITHGASGSGYTGDLHILIKLLLPGSIKRTYNLQNKTIAKIFSRIFDTDLDEMMEHLEQGDVSETVFKFFEESDFFPPCKKSNLTIHDVDGMLGRLEGLTREEDQENVLKTFARKCTANDLKAVIRLIKGDLRITAGDKHILEALDPNAHEAFKASRDLEDVIKRTLEQKKSGGSGLEVRASLMTPVAPMLAEACKSVEQAMKKCPNGMYSEIKYDGERVQLHMDKGNFQFYSRSLKPVQKHKIVHFEEVIPKAFPHGHSMILDSEVLLVDNNTGIPLPFGTLGVHKKQKFTSATVCLFIFDILHFNGENLMKRPIRERRKLLSDNINEIKNRVMLSEMQFVNKPEDLKSMIVRVIKDGLEGLVLKDVKSIYEPGKRHWLKVKKDYLCQGAMADTADLVVLGAYIGTGSKGGLMSVFLMGVHDPHTDRWKTVTKVGNGHDDQTIDKINKELKVTKIQKDFNRVPKWLLLNRQYVPDYIVEDPKSAPVWEITGTEFSKSDAHTADGISIRFPRVTRIRDDKDWKTATNLPRLKKLFAKSKEESDISALLDKKSGTSTVKIEQRSMKLDDGASSSPLKRKRDPGTTPVKKIPKIKQENGGKASFLHDVFTDMKFAISSSVKDQEKMKRYIVAFDGDIVENYDVSSATHTIGEINSDDIPSDCKKLTEDYIWTCIKKKKLVA